MLRLPRRACRGCGRTRSVYPPEVIPRFHYARPVIESALERRRAGASWLQCAERCTVDVLVELSLVRRWAHRFGLRSHHPVMPFSPAKPHGMLPKPVPSSLVFESAR